MLNAPAVLLISIKASRPEEFFAACTATLVELDVAESKVSPGEVKSCTIWWP
jgi:hypothetical protein